MYTRKIGQDYLLWNEGQVRVWGTILVFGCLLGKVVECSGEAKGLNGVLSEFVWMTGPRVYFDYFWVYFFMFKLLSCCFCFAFGKVTKKYWMHALTDAVIVIIFFGLHKLTVLIKSETGFKASGHSLMMSVSLQLMNKESYFSVKYTKLRLVQYFSWVLISCHYFFLFWTCLAYHTFLEVLIGSLAGFIYPPIIIYFFIPN